MPADDDRSAPEASPAKPPAKHYTLDALAKGLASESLSRGQALRMLGSALAGGALAVFIPGVAWGQQDGPVDFGPKGPVNHGPNGPVNHGPNGPVNSGGTGTCSGSICSKDSDCEADCKYKCGCVRPQGFKTCC